MQIFRLVKRNLKRTVARNCGDTQRSNNPSTMRLQTARLPSHQEAPPTTVSLTARAATTVRPLPPTLSSPSSPSPLLLLPPPPLFSREALSTSTLLAIPPQEPPSTTRRRNFAKGNTWAIVTATFIGTTVTTSYFIPFATVGDE